jgi:hypothetical protein
MFLEEIFMVSLSISSPIGNLVLDEEDDAITAIRWADERTSNGSPLLAEAARQLDAYFAGRLSHFDLPLAAWRFRIRDPSMVGDAKHPLR